MRAHANPKQATKNEENVVGKWGSVVVRVLRTAYASLRELRVKGKSYRRLLQLNDKELADEA